MKPIIVSYHRHTRTFMLMISVASLLGSCFQKSKEYSVFPCSKEGSPYVSTSDANKILLENYRYCESESTLTVELTLSKCDSEKILEEVVFCKINQTDYNRFYGRSDSLELIGAFDRFTMNPSTSNDDAMVPFGRLSNWSHTILITGLNPKGFDFHVETSDLSGTCSFSGHARFEHFDNAIMTSFSRKGEEYVLDENEQPVSDCQIEFWFFANGVLLLNHGFCSEDLCGHTADLGNWYLIFDN